MKITPEEEVDLKKSIFTWGLTLAQFSISPSANQATGLSVNVSLTPNGSFQKINGLFEMASSTITCCIKNRKSWTFC